ncbi:lipid transfer protein [Artemisia annua]|uniref:Lipid transfer protein n=1 Tax=Artemisia annua TaxID=35608 RepID=A0A2U1KHK4_ARTAN|nr:lipid transfer protein [Artemisia annua]
MRSATNITVCALAILVMVLATPKVAFSATCSVNSLKPCLPAFTSSSPPTASCCTTLKQQQPCFCGYIKNPSLKQYVNSPNAKKTLDRLFCFLFEWIIFVTSIEQQFLAMLLIQDKSIATLHLSVVINLFVTRWGQCLLDGSLFTVGVYAFRNQ